ncbi:hypothetical protein [Phytohabitans aurantiacus]|uniref:Uncharacterized protein n=1 Tax=Phytohabitans aurantiacus TaxID=3016789 RepID=A0ABQ5QY69_9ACTN|nr:hypothetical protein [Phytohabitans aurantiacus]GLH99445.1 hypothetical protein Pa4123_47210 [Phytohabitans aurantiacus]
MGPTIRILVGGLGAIMLAAGTVVTIWGMVAGKDVNSVGLAAIFVVGIALVYAGVFNLLPAEIGIGDKGKIKMQAAADAVKAVKEAANTEAAAIAQTPTVLQDVVSAKDESAAAVVVENALKELVSRMPATADVLREVE